MAVCQEWEKQDFNFQKHIAIWKITFPTMSIEAIFVGRNEKNLLTIENMASLL
jgi:hypothetical protein